MLTDKVFDLDIGTEKYKLKNAIDFFVTKAFRGSLSK